MGQDMHMKSSLLYVYRSPFHHLSKFRLFPSAKSASTIQFSLLLVLLLLLTAPSRALADEEYQFERMWPTLQQPWYFSDPYGVAVDNNGFIYLADTYNNRIQKFTVDGQFVGK